MCGLAGIIRRNGSLSGYERHSVSRMLELTRHRGPDDSGVCGISQEGLNVRNEAGQLNGEITALLGFNRLSIQDISDAGRQPMLSPDGKAVITFNGEIYNTSELRLKLRRDFGEIIYRGHSDTEVILQLYIHYGFENTIRMLNGMFAIIIADTEQDCIYIARDRYGIIPLHISIEKDRIIYCSELKGFLGLQGFDRSPNLEALSKNIMYYYPKDFMYKNVINVPAGHYYTLSISNYNGGGDLSLHKYFDLNDYSQGKISQSWSELIERTEFVLRDCVERQLIGDVNLGILLSGGIDSTLAAKYASDSYSASGKIIQGFSLINTRFKNFTEENYIDHAASRINVDLNKYDFDDAFFLNFFEQSIYASETILHAPSMGTYELLKNASSKVRVMLCGEGSDEIAGGYRNFSVMKGSELIRRLLMGRLRRLSRYGVIYDDRNFLASFERNMSDNMCRRIYPAFSVEKTIAEREQEYNAMTGTAFDKVRKLYFVDRLITVLEKQNKICMYHSVENRVPFLDNAIVDLMFSIPEKYLMHPCFIRAVKRRDVGSLYEGKYIFKKISERIYGRDFAFRPKSWISIPLAEYISAPDFINYIRCEVMPGMASRGMFDMNVFNECMNALNFPQNAMCVWKAINMETWLKIFVDGKVPA